MKKFKETAFYQILFNPKKGRMLSYVAYAMIIGIIYIIITMIIN
jgi:hypothetical protein